MTQEELYNIRIGIGNGINKHFYIGLIEDNIFKVRRRIDTQDKVAIRMAYEWMTKNDKEFREILTEDNFDIFKKVSRQKE